MVCHACQKSDLELLLRVDQHGIAPGDEGHDITYSHAEIFFCRHCRGSEIEIHRHDCFDYQDVSDEYAWYLLAPFRTGELLRVLKACPSPASADCACAIHGALRASCAALSSSAGRGVYEADWELADGLPRIRGRRNVRRRPE
jgi:hypothetical protein